MKAAKVVRRWPEALVLLAKGRVTLTTIRLLAPHLRPANQTELFAEAVGRNKRQVQELLARRFPKPDVATSIRKLPTARPSASASTSTVSAPLGEAVFDGRAGRPMPSSAPMIQPPGLFSSAPASEGKPNVLAGVATGEVSTALPAGGGVPRAARSARLTIEPLSAKRYRIQFTARASLRDKLELAQGLLRHAVPSGDAAEILERALDALIEVAVKRKYAMTSRPARKRGHDESSRYVPPEVKRAVFIRDRGRCA